MANNFVREPIVGGDSNSWATYELQQNRRSEGQMSAYLYDDSGTLKLSTGLIGIYDGTNRGTIVIDTITTVSMSSVSNSNWGKIEISVSGTTVTISAADISGATTESTIPSDYLNAYDGEKGGYYITATKRCIGIAYKSSGGVLSSVISDNTQGLNLDVAQNFNIANKIKYNLEADTFKKDDYKILTEKNISYTTISSFGNSISLGISTSKAISALSYNSIAAVYSTNLRTYSFDGSDWSAVGNVKTIAGIGSPAITALDSTTIAFIDTTQEDLRTYSFDGSDWAQVGNDFNIAGIGTPSITALDSTTIAFIDSTQGDLRTYSFDGSDWAQVGNDFNIAASPSFPSISKLTKNTIAYIDNSNDNLLAYSFDGSDWGKVGGVLNIGGTGIPKITSLLSNSLAYINHAAGDLQTYLFNNGIDVLRN